MNMDGFPDILVSNSGSDTLSYFEAIGDGTFKKPFTMNTGREPLAFEVGDFNGDKILDIAVSNYGDGQYIYHSWTKRRRLQTKIKHKSGTPSYCCISW